MSRAASGQRENIDPPCVLLEADGRCHIEDARDRGNALVQTYRRFDLVPHSSKLPDLPHAKCLLGNSLAGSQTACISSYRGPNADCKENEDKYRQDGGQSLCCGIPAIEASCVQLVKVVIRCNAKRTSGTKIPSVHITDAVAVAVLADRILCAACVYAALARRPIPE
eukprot:3191063-Prymnesium_polylepis.1